VPKHAAVPLLYRLPTCRENPVYETEEEVVSASDCESGAGSGSERELNTDEEEEAKFKTGE
jgi:hypothetical protein